MKANTFRGVSWDALFLAFVKIVTTLSAILQTKLLAMGLSLEEFGSYSQISIVISVGTSLTLLGLGDSINYFYNSNSTTISKFQKTRIVNTIFCIEMVAGFLFMILVAVFRGGISEYFSNGQLGALLVIAAAKPAMDNLLYLFQILYVSSGKAKLIAVRNLAITCLRVIIIYISVYVLDGLIWIFSLLIILDVLQFLFFEINFGLGNFFVCPFRISKKDIVSILAYGLPMGIFAITSMMSREMDKLVIGRLTNTETLAIYANCSKILPFDIIVVSFATVLVPYIMWCVSGNEQKKAAAIFSNYMKIGYYSVWILGAAVLITAEQVIAMLYTEEYIRGSSIFIIYVLDSMLKFASMHLILTAGGKAKQIMLYSFGTMLLNLVLNIVLYNLIGMTGPALATLVTTGLYTYLILRSSLKLLDLRWADILDLRDIFSFAAVLLISGFAFWGINQLMLDAAVNKYVAMLISAGGFCVLNLLLNRKRIFGALKALNELRM